MAMIVEEIPEHVEKMSEYASELGLELSEYKTRIVFGPDGIAGMFFVPHIIGENTVFIHYNNDSKAVSKAVIGKYQTLENKILSENKVNIEDCVTDQKCEGDNWERFALKGASQH